jgi:hypothetical protein
MAEHDVAALLAVDYVAPLLERSDKFSPRDYG